MMKKSSALEIIRISAVLTVICLCVSLVVSLVYGATHERYMANLQAQKDEAISSLFDGKDITTEALPLGDAAVQELYRVGLEGETIGYCANVAAAGFGGNIEMMVAVTPGGKLIGVDIIALSETPGLGSRVDDAEYLSQYAGASVRDDLALGENIDAISGATISSRAVLAGVKQAMEALKPYVEVAE